MTERSVRALSERTRQVVICDRALNPRLRRILRRSAPGGVTRAWYPCAGLDPPLTFHAVFATKRCSERVYRGNKHGYPAAAELGVPGTDLDITGSKVIVARLRPICLPAAERTEP